MQSKVQKCKICLGLSKFGVFPTRCIIWLVLVVASMAAGAAQKRSQPQPQVRLDSLWKKTQLGDHFTEVKATRSGGSGSESAVWSDRSSWRSIYCQCYV